MAKRTRCSVKGCRKMRTTELFCPQHQRQTDEAGAPIEAVKRLSELDRLRFVELDTRVRNELQSIKILDLEQQQQHIRFEQEQRARKEQRQQLMAAIATTNAENKRLLEELSGRYDFDPAHVAIDDRTGVINELPPDK